MVVHYPAGSVVICPGPCLFLPAASRLAPVGTGYGMIPWGCWAPQPHPLGYACAAASSSTALNRASKVELNLKTISDTKYQMWVIEVLFLTFRRVETFFCHGNNDLIATELQCFDC